MSLRFGVMMDRQEAYQMNAIQLAYLGDSVWEMIVRYNQIVHKLNVHHMHQNTVGLVNAHRQSQLLYCIQEKLTEQEAEIVRRGRNAHARHTVPKNQNAEEYAASTGFEALLGYLYLTGQDSRIHDLLDHMKKEITNG